MSFQSNKFLGLTCADFKTSLGWGQNLSQLNVQLVQDNLDGDLADAPPIGSPVYFEFGSLSFAGLLQKFGEVSSVNGLPVFDAVIVDPREILDGTQVITASYSGTIPNSIFNLINAYGYWENKGFGQSQSTSAGMPWAQVINAIIACVNNPTGTPFGGPLNYRGFTYSLDISEVPRPPGYYRLPAGYISLLDIINTLCEDSGCDFFVQLIGLTIKIRVVSRFFQPPLGTIQSLVFSNTFSGSTVLAEASVENRNEVTSVFLTGGEKTGIFLADTFFSYWGNDINNVPIIGFNDILTDYGIVEFANLNAADCADIIGSTTYKCSVIEMRYALFGVEIWTAFIAKSRTDIANFIGATMYGNMGVANPIFAPDIINDGATNITNALSQTLSDRKSRLFDLVHRYAEDFYGKQFLVTIDGLQASIDAETGQITTSLEPTSAGYMEFGASSLGVPDNRLDVLQEADERVTTFAYYNNIVGADTARLNWEETAVDASGQMWCRASVNSRILFSGNTPYIHVRLGGALYQEKQDEFGDASLAGKVFALDGNALKNLNNNAIGGTIGTLGIYPATIYPDVLGIPLKSNVEVYGPWFIGGAPGKVRVEQDSGLTPWDYGSADIMDLAGQARVASAFTNQQLSETGALTFAGAPAFSLGDIMQTGGPNLTNLEVQFGPNGVTTSYRWQTFTPRFGLFSRQNSERLRRVSQGQIQQRREFRKALNRSLAAAAIIDKAKRGAKFNKEFWEKKKSPHTILMTQNVTSGSDIRVGGGLETYESALNFLNNGSDFNNRAIMSITGLIRGFSTNPSATTNLSKYTSIGSFGGSNNPITINTYNPFASGNDIDILSWGDTYAGANANSRGNDPSNTRGIALRGPIVVSGWGIGVDGKAYPDGSSSSFASNTFRSSKDWKSGAIDLLWDNKRGIWTSHDLVSGTTSGSTASGATGTLNVGGDSGWQLSFKNIWGTTIASGKTAVIGWCYNLSTMVPISVDC